MPAASTSLGSILRQERLRKELDFATIVRETRICTYILKAIEEDRFDGIPGGAYRRLFIRQYARALGMDGEAAIAEFRNQYQEPPLPLPVPPKRRRSRFWADLAWALAAIAGIGSGYHFLHAKHPGFNFAEIAVPKIDTAQTSRPPVQVPVMQPPIQQATGTTVEPPAAPSSPPVHVAFTATEPVWINVKCDGNTTYAGVLEVPQSRTFDATGTVTAVVGNAGGLLIWLNGKPLGSLGAHGEVETIELTLNGARRIARRVLSTNEQNSVPQL